MDKAIEMEIEQARALEKKLAQMRVALADKADRYFDIKEVYDDLWNQRYDLWDNDMADSPEDAELDAKLSPIAAEMADIEDDFREYIDCMPEGIFKEMAERKFYSDYPEWRDTFIAEFLVDDEEDE